MPESTQHKLDRVRPPRVQITYDVETLGSIVKTELPFVVGIMADLSGNGLKNPVRDPATLKPLKERKYIEIDRDNFNEIMEKIEPKVKLSSGAYSDTVTFTKLEDFNPINVLRNVTDLRKKFESRTRLANLVAKLDGNITLQKKLAESYKNLPQKDKDALKNYYDVINPGETRVAGTPSVTKTTAKKDVLTTTGLVINRNEADADEVTHFKITGITGGELFKQPGTPADKIANDDFITFAEGQAGLKFKASGDANGSFKVQSSTSGTDNTDLSDVMAVTVTVEKGRRS